MLEVVLGRWFPLVTYQFRFPGVHDRARFELQRVTKHAARYHQQTLRIPVPQSERTDGAVDLRTDEGFHRLGGHRVSSQRVAEPFDEAALERAGFRAFERGGESWAFIRDRFVPEFQPRLQRVRGVFVDDTHRPRQQLSQFRLLRGEIPEEGVHLHHLQLADGIAAAVRGSPGCPELVPQRRDALGVVGPCSEDVRGEFPCPVGFGFRCEEMGLNIAAPVAGSQVAVEDVEASFL